MNRTRILFVDDETAILEGLQNLLRKERRRWDLVFAPGAQAALAELGKAPFDIVVSDMRMPGMDGAALLFKVKAEYPGTARLVLSGHADRAAVLRALPVAHQFLSKPCDAVVLRAAIERTCDLHRLLENETVRRVVGNVEKLPSVPRTYTALTEAAANADAGIADFARIVESDPAMSAKVLQLVNSAYFGSAHRVVAIQQAVGFLGLELLKGLALTAHVFAAMEARAVEGFSLEKLQRDSVLTARVAKRFLKDPKLGDEAFTAALVHDIGKIIIAMGLPEEFTKVLREAESTGSPLDVIERNVIGVTHAEVGAYLLGVWGLPFSIVESVAYHHRPSAVTEGPCEVLAAVHVADALVDQACRGRMGGAPEAALDLDFLARTGVMGELNRWRALCDEELAHANQKN